VIEHYDIQHLAPFDDNEAVFERTDVNCRDGEDVVLGVEKDEEEKMQVWDNLRFRHAKWLVLCGLWSASRGIIKVTQDKSIAYTS